MTRAERLRMLLSLDVWGLRQRGLSPSQVAAELGIGLRQAQRIIATLEPGTSDARRAAGGRLGRERYLAQHGRAKP